MTTRRQLAARKPADMKFMGKQNKLRAKANLEACPSLMAQDRILVGEFMLTFQRMHPVALCQVPPLNIDRRTKSYLTAYRSTNQR